VGFLSKAEAGEKLVDVIRAKFSVKAENAELP